MAAPMRGPVLGNQSLSRKDTRAHPIRREATSPDSRSGRALFCGTAAPGIAHVWPCILCEPSTGSGCESELEADAAPLAWTPRPARVGRSLPLPPGPSLRLPGDPLPASKAPCCTPGRPPPHGSRGLGAPVGRLPFPGH